MNFTHEFSDVTAEIRKFSLTIILIRAGLEIDPEAFKKVYKTILKLGLVPWAIECSVVAVMSYFLFDFPWTWAFALGAIIAAVSPAVVVPCLFRLRTKGYGVAKGIPTCIGKIKSFSLTRTREKERYTQREKKRKRKRERKRN